MKNVAYIVFWRKKILSVHPVGHLEVLYKVPLVDVHHDHYSESTRLSLDYLISMAVANPFPFTN
jgi:hypothetical protein